MQMTRVKDTKTGESHACCAREPRPSLAWADALPQSEPLRDSPTHHGAIAARPFRSGERRGWPLGGAPCAIPPPRRTSLTPRVAQWRQASRSARPAPAPSAARAVRAAASVPQASAPTPLAGGGGDAGACAVLVHARCIVAHAPAQAPAAEAGAAVATAAAATAATGAATARMATS